MLLRTFINIIDAHDLSIIQKAVDIAQKKYSQWYSGEQHRGANGFFSWLRHGSLGQQNAFLMNQELNNTHTAYEDAITLINEFLMDDNKTPYHRHSFASFLLDELNQIPSSPWSNIKCDSETKLYDRLEVIKLLAPIAHITDEVPMNSYYVS